MTGFVASLTLLALTVPAVRAAETDQQRGKRIIESALAALGGHNFLQMRDRMESGRAYSFYREQLSGLSRATIYSRYMNPPKTGKLGVEERQAFGKNQESAVLFAMDKGHEITFRGARPLPDTQLERYRESTLHNVLYILRVRLSEPGLVFESRGSDVVENQPVETVDITDADNRSVTVQFNQSTKLPIGQIFYRRDPLTKERMAEVTLFSKYREVGDGVMWPFTIERFRNGERIYAIYSDSVTINQDLKDSLFTLPSDVKLLKQQK